MAYGIWHIRDQYIGLGIYYLIIIITKLIIIKSMVHTKAMVIVSRGF